MFGGIARSALVFGGVCNKQTPKSQKKKSRTSVSNPSPPPLVREPDCSRGSRSSCENAARATTRKPCIHKTRKPTKEKMGSTDKAVITGFICRLCSKMNRFVIHIYGEEGERMKLAEKINTYLPISINMNDPLPKTACLHCIERLEAHHELMEQIMFTRRRLNTDNKTATAGASSYTTPIDRSLPDV